MADTSLKFIITGDASQGTAAINSFNAKVSEMNGASQSAASNYRKNMEQVTTCTQQMQAQLERATRAAGALTAIFAGGGAIGAFANQILQAGLAVEKYNAILKASTGSASLATAELKFIREQAQRLGLEMNSATESYARFLGATKNTSIEGAKARQVFIGISEGLAAMKLPAEQSQRAFLQLQQMMSKGKLMAEDMTTLSESLPGAYQMVADAMGKPAPVIRDMMQKGELLASEVLPKLAAMMHQTYGKAAVEAADGAQGAINRFNNALQVTREEFAARLLPIMTTGLQSLTANLATLQNIGVAAITVLAGAFAGKLVTAVAGTVAAQTTAATAAWATAAALEAEAVAARSAAAASMGLNPALNATASALAQKSAQATAAATATGSAATATRLASGAVSALGGPIGVLITLLGVAAAAWNYYKNQQDRALNQKIADDENDPANRLVKEISLLKEQIALRQKSKAQLAQEQEESGRSQYTSKLAELDRKIQLYERADEYVDGTNELKQQRAAVAEKLRQYETLLGAHKKYQAEIDADNKRRADADKAALAKKTSGAATATDFNRTKGVQDAIRAQWESFWAWEDAGLKAHVKNQVAALEWQKEQGLITTADYIKKKELLEVSAIDKEIERNNKRIKDMQDSTTIKMGAGNDPYSDQAYKHAQAQTELNKAITKGVELQAQKDGMLQGTSIALGRDALKTTKDQLSAEQQLLSLGGDTYQATMKQLELDKLSRVQLDSQTKAIYEQVDAVKKLKAAQEETNRINAIKDSTTDINISMMNDPYAQERAAMEERYRREAELIQQNIDLKIAAGTLELSEYEALSDKLLAMAAKRDQDIANNQRRQSEEGWQAVVGAAQKAFPKLTGLDKAVTAAFKDHTKYRLATEQERAAGAQKLVKDETRSNLSMYSSYAGAAGAVFEGLAATQDTTSRAGFETAKAFNIAAAVMNTAMAITNALATVQPYPAAVAAAAMAGALGVVQIATIASTSFGGTTGTVSMPSAGSFGGSGGGSSTVGTKIGVALQDPLQAASTDAMVQLAESAESASMAIGDLADVFERISATFEEGIGASLVSRAKGLLVGTVLPTGYTTDTSRFNDKVFQDGINAIFNDALQALNAAAVGLGVAPQTSVTARSIEFGGDWDEDRIQKELEGYLQQAMDTFAKGFNGLEEYAKAGENASDALIRLSTAMTAFNDVAELAGITLLEGLSGANMASKIADVMGGQDEMTEAIESYFGAVFTDAEQSVREAEKAHLDLEYAFKRINADAVLQAKQNQQLYTETWIDLDATTKQLIRIPKTAQELADELKNVGIQVPATREEFRGLVNSLDLTTDSGASTFAALMNVAESFGTVMEAADEAAAKLREYQDLEVRLLNAQGNTAAADALERKLSAERELQDAITSGMDAAYIARLQEVLALEDQAAAAEQSAAATSKAAEALTTATKAAESSVVSITSAFANLTKAKATADAQTSGAMVGGVQLSASEYKSYGSFVTFLDQASAELQKIADMGFPEELQAAVDQITAMVDTASRQLAGQVASARLLAGDAAGALAAYQKWTMPKDGFTNPDGSFNAGAFNRQYMRNQAAQALLLGAEASANALRVVNAMAVTGALDYSGSNELQMYALWDLIDYFGNGFSGDVGKTITTTMRPALDDMARIAVYTAYAPQGPGVNEIRRAQIQQQSLTSMYTANGETYYGDQSVAYGKGLQTLNRLMMDNSISAEEYASSLNRLEIATGVTAETTINTYEEIAAAQLAAAQALMQAGLSSMNYYLDQISVMGRELLQTAIDTGTALGKVTESIGRMKSWSDVLTLSVNTAAELADLEANKGRADIARAIAAAAADAQTRLTTADAAAAQNVLQGMTQFAGMDTVKLRDISLLIDGLKQFDPASFGQSFTRISAALVDGMITLDQYAALYSYSMQVYEGTAKDALASLEQTGSDALQILENAINKAKEAQQAIVDNLSGLSESLHSLIEGLQTPIDETLLNRQAAQAQLRALVASGGLPAAGEFDAAMKALAEPSKQLFSSFEAYSEDFYKTAIDLSTLSTRTDSQLSIAEQEMQRLDGILQAAKDQWDELHGTKLAVMSVEEALVNFQNAVIALSQGQTPALAIAGLNSFAVGTNYVPYDMVAQIHQGERIIPRADNYRLMQGNDEILEELRAVKSELKATNAQLDQLRSEQRSQAAVIATNTDNTVKAVRRVMPDGDALAVRIAA